MATKSFTFSSVISGSPMITSEKLIGSENYLSWSASVELWFMGQGYEDHLVTQEADIPEVNRVQCRKIDAQLCSVLWQSVDPKIQLHLRAYKTCFKFWNQAKGLYTNDIQRLYKIDKFFMVLTLIGLRPDLKTVRDQILGSSSIPSLDDVFARLLQEDAVVTEVEANVLIAPIAISLATLMIGVITYMGGLPALPTWPRHLILSRLSLLIPPHLKVISLTDSEYDDYLRYQATKSASVAQTGNVSACLTHTSSLGPWILDSGASDHISGPEYGKTIGIGRESQGLYHLTAPSTPAVCISTDAPLLIHSRLGHPSLSKFQKMVPSFSSLSSLACESCQLGKHTHVSFPKRLNNRAKSPFELVHTDVWGPCRTASTLGFQYFVTFIDDYSRCTWLFLMKNRAEIFSIFQKFYAEIQTQFNISIRVLRSDNAREYFSTPFTSFMSQHGIIHQSSCAHTPQQNGVAERKNRHLVETTRTLLLHSHVPFRFWGNVFLQHVIRLIVCHHIATKCIFLGYSKLQKGYRCYSSETHRYFLSADVTFFEDSPFFSTFESLPVLKSYSFPLSPHLMQCLLAHFRFIIVIIVSMFLLLWPMVPANSLPIPSASPAPALPPSADLPIALRRGNRSTRNPHPIYNFLSYHRLSSPYSAFVSAISSVSLPKSTPKAISHPGWRQAMVDEMAALHSNGTWDLVVLPSGKSTVGCRWVYTVKVGPDGQVDRLKAHLVAKGYTQILKNVFLHGDLAEEVYMEQPPGFVAQGESGLVCKLRRSLYGLKQSPRAWLAVLVLLFRSLACSASSADHSVFYHHNSSGQCIYPVVYVDDIVITGSDQNGIQKLKQHFFTHFQTKDLEKLKYFLGIEIAQSSSGMVLSQRKYALDILEETDMLDCKPVDTPMDPNVKLIPGQGEPLGDPGRYRTPGQGVLYENKGHYQVVGYTDADWAGSPTDRRSTSGYCVFIGGNLISWKSKKQDVVARSSAEAEYRGMALATCELIWLKHLVRELRFGKDEQMKLICDNQVALHIASNPVFMKEPNTLKLIVTFIERRSHQDVWRLVLSIQMIN
ncbi:Retrovirus-related Pol polyprotein from transposon TNT 1-94 [Vitis vinifera]|uniref:Retrovirus-related Pol polyprotein from transposon TNT 1-94 n=1 Tax=Vitis vinifera TaxID=29760 RepID=A0A438EHJ4_VITVI|nr:Retrovirus-related Pol polyprotein from transposon TNT 1-94 [Vitis vinifera]